MRQRFLIESILLFTLKYVSYFGHRIFHVVDSLLFPPTISDIVEITHQSTTWNTSECHKFLEITDLFTTGISSSLDADLTFFCPSSEAFNNLNLDDYERLTDPLWSRHAQEFMLNHMSEGRHTREELVKMVESGISHITMLSGEVYELRARDSIPSIRNGVVEIANVEFGDMIATDG